jgi:ankyrin repeat protein
LDVIKVFEKAGYEWRSDRSYQGQTPLYQAAENGHLPVVMHLANQGAYLDVPSQTDMPLHVAIKNNHLDVASFLICEGAMPDYQDKKGQTPAALLVDKILNDKESHPRKTMALFRCLSLLMEKGVNVRIGAQEMMDLKDYYEGAAEKLDTTFVPFGHKKPRLIQKGHRTKQTEVGLDQVYKLLYEREY